MKFTYDPSPVKTSLPAMVIGFPGLRGQEERHRIKEQLRQFKEQGYDTVLFDYANITHANEGKRLVCSPEINGKFVAGIITNLTKDTEPSRVAFVSNSLGTILATKCLLEMDKRKYPGTFISYSPLPGWPQFLSPEARKPFESGNLDLPIQTEEDRQQRIERVIGKDALKKLMELDCLGDLRKRKTGFPGVNVFTILGTQDKVSSPDGMREYHDLMGGTPGNLTEFEAGHDLVQKTTTFRTIDYTVNRIVTERIPNSLI